MFFNEKIMRNCAIAAAVSLSVVMFGYASSDMRSDTGFAYDSGIQSIQVQATPTTVQPADATSGASEATEEPASDAVSSATDESAVKDSAYCLKCHGPFEKLAERTADYVTEWDEKANPHVYVPHESKTIVECAECHTPHEVPFKADEGAATPNVNYCYSCHHAETLANCNTCHNE